MVPIENLQFLYLIQKLIFLQHHLNVENHFFHNTNELEKLPITEFIQKSILEGIAIIRKQPFLVHVSIAWDENEVFLGWGGDGRIKNDILYSVKNNFYSTKNQYRTTRRFNSTKGITMEDVRPLWK